MVDNRLMSDEIVHFRQIARFVSYDFFIEPSPAMLPGFHVVVAWCAWLTGWTSVAGVRTLSFLIAVATVGVFHLLARQATPDIAVTRTLQFAFLPILFPFFFLIYTDVLSLLLVLTMMLCDLRGRHAFGGVAGLLACLVRQNNIIWVAFSALVSYADKRRRLPHAGLARYWVHGATMVLFGAFVIVHGGVAFGGAGHQVPRIIHLTNVFFLLFVVSLLFWPAFVARRHAIAALLRQRRTWLVLTVLFGAYWVGFVNDHPWNNLGIRYFLRNAALVFFSSSVPLKLVFFVPVAFAVLGLWATPLRRPGWLLYATTALSLVPLWLVEQRYYLIPLTLFLLMRQPAPAAVESTELGLFAMMAIVFYVVIERGWGFL